MTIPHNMAAVPHKNGIHPLFRQGSNTSSGKESARHVDQKFGDIFKPVQTEEHIKTLKDIQDA